MDALGKEEKKNKAWCRYWLQGRCANPRCTFRHGDGPQRGGGSVWRRNPSTTTTKKKDGIKTEQYLMPATKKRTKPSSSITNKDDEEEIKPNTIEPSRPNSTMEEDLSSKIIIIDQKPLEKEKELPCSSSAKENICSSSPPGDNLSLLAQLQGHNQMIRGFAFNLNNNKLLSADKAGHANIWDCVTGNCIANAHLGQEIGCILGDGPWVYAAIPNVLQAWNLDSTSADQTINGPEGRVYAFATAPDYIFAGVQDGTIAVWKKDADSFRPTASLTAHQGAVVSLAIGGTTWLYSGSVDTTIKVWDIATLQCLNTLTGHMEEVTSLLLWGQFLISSSLDKTIKVWAAQGTENLQVVHTHSQEHSVLGLHGMPTQQGKYILLCSCTDNIVRLLELPSFSEVGRIFSKEEVRAMANGPDGIIFTGDGSGVLRVWKWNPC